MDKQYMEALHSLQALTLMGAIDFTTTKIPCVDPKRAPTISPRRVAELAMEYSSLTPKQLKAIRKQSLKAYKA